MAEPVAFTSMSPRFELPFLFSGQAQKEFFFNEAIARTDILLHAAIEGEIGAPPADPVAGECWLVGNDASGVFAGRQGEIASLQVGGWLFVAPRDGMRVLDRSTGQDLAYQGGWKRPQTPALPSGGSFVDVEARAAIGELISALVAGGILSNR